MDTEKKENKEVNKFSLLIVAVIVLVLIIVGAGYYIYHQKQQMTDLVETFDLEKESLEDEYNELSLQYEGYKFSVGNDSLVALLSTEQAKVQRLLEELRTVKATNAKEIARLKKELNTLRKIMRNYVIQIDSLNRENEQLKVEKKEAVLKYQRATSQAATLKKEKEKLTERVTLASRLDATDINVTPVNSRGKLAKRIKKMQQFVVTFKIVKNITAPVGEKMVYVRIMKPDDDILVKSRADVFAFEGKEINYSMKKMIEYEGDFEEAVLNKKVEIYRSFLSRHFDNMIVLTGAGSSFGIGKTEIKGMTMKKLWEEIVNKCGKESIEKLGKKINYKIFGISDNDIIETKKNMAKLYQFCLYPLLY